MPTLTKLEIDQFRSEGYLVIDQLVDDETTHKMADAYQRLVDDPTLSPGDRHLGGLTRQIMVPSYSDPDFDDNPIVDATHRIAEQLIGEAAYRVFDMLIYKGPGHPHETPWHQDMSYQETPFAPAGTMTPSSKLQFWVALDDADEENGCMHFVGGLHDQPLLEHVVASGEPDDPGRLLALRDPEEQLDLSQVVAAPVKAGGCTIHAYATPHYTPPNTSDHRPRRAYILNFDRAPLGDERP